MSTKIAYITDIHLDEEFPKLYGVDTRKNWKTILEDISSRGIDKIIFGGDIGEKAANKWFFESLCGFTTTITLGNHDCYSEVIKYYKFGVVEKQRELYYSQEHIYHKYIFLDSSSGSISKPQFTWFKKQLFTVKDVIVFIHHPILAVEAKVDQDYSLKERSKIEIQLLNFENDVVIFCGHYHCEDESKKGNIRQIITPASSYQVEKIPDEIEINTNTYGYRIIELNKKEISTRLINLV